MELLKNTAPISVPLANSNVDCLPPPNHWQDLIRMARLGDDVALGEIATQTWRYLIAVANQHHPHALHGKFGASDIVQISLLEARENIDDFQGDTEADLRGWLKAIVIHNVLDESKRYQNTHSRNVKRELPMNHPLASEFQDRFENTASDTVRQEESDEQLWRAVDQLPPHQRQVVEARHRFGFSNEQIALQMQITEGNVRKLWHRASKKLRQALADNHDEA